MALSEIGDAKCIDDIKKNMEKADEEEKARYYLALYKLGDFEYFMQFLNGIFHKNYRVRCFTANLVSDLTTSLNRSLIINVLTSALRNEETDAAFSSIKDTIKHLSGIEDV